MRQRVTVVVLVWWKGRLNVVILSTAALQRCRQRESSAEWTE